MTVSQGWIQVAQNAATSPDPARTGFDLAAAAVMFLCVCWMSPKISSAMLGGVASMSGGDLTAVGMGVGLAAVGGGLVATQYASRGSDALLKVKEAAAVGSGGPGGGAGGAGGATPRLGGGGNNGGGSGSLNGGGSSAATQNGMPSGMNQPSPPSRPSAAQTSGQQPSPPPTTVGSANDSFLSALERTTARAHYAMNSLRIPHDGPSHAPPSSSTGHGDS